MRTLQSYERQLEKLREAHTAAFNAQEWNKMQSVGDKMIRLLDAIVLHFPHWIEQAKK